MASEAPGPMTPMPTPTFVAGPAITPTEALTSWLDARAPTELVRIPVAVAVSPVGISGGTVGTAGDSLSVALGDGRLGVSLVDQAHRHCGNDATTCGLWLWGTWAAGRLEVSKVEGPASAEALAQGPVSSAVAR